MELLKSFLSSPGIWRRRQVRPSALKSSFLAKLPPELIICIAEFLPPIAAIFFSLCCRPIRSLLGIQYQELCRDEENFDTFELLEVLERDLPNHVACYHCKKFHAIEHAKRHIYSNRYFIGRPSRQIPLCWMADLYNQTMFYIDWNFNFTVFQMAMKRYHQGADSSSLLDLMLCKGEICERSSEIHRTTVLIRIVDGSLLVRKQSVFLVNHASNKPFLSDSGFIICPHFGRARRKEPAGGMNKCRRLQWDSQEIFESWGDLIQCEFCAMEFQIDLKDSREQGDVIVFTQWQNLGEGKSPLDYQWRSHVARRDRKNWEKVDFQAGSICSAFEGGEEFGVGPFVAPENWKE